MMRDRRLIDVPPLSDLGRQRIRQAVFDRLDDETVVEPPVAAPPRAGRPTALLAGVGVAAAAALALLWLRGGDQRPVARAPSPSRITTGESATQVTVGDARINAGPHAALTVNELGDAGVQVLIERGDIEFEVAPRGERPPFVVMAADVRVEVVGTVFRVARDGDDVSVSVARGVVRVTRGGEEASVAAGQSWPVLEQNDEDVEIDEPELTFDPQPAKTARARRKQPAPPPVEEAAPPSARERYEAAVAAEKTRPAEALATYRALAAEGGAWADNALFAAARLELDLGRKDAARRSLGAYLKRYPRGANAGLARTLLDGLQ